MGTKFNALVWCVALLTMTLAFWVNLAAAQDEVAAAEEATNFGPIWAILLVGVLAVVALGFLMNSSNSSHGNSDS